MKLLVIAAAVFTAVSGHGRLADPPARTSANLLGFPNVPADYNDGGMSCGGYEVCIHLYLGISLYHTIESIHIVYSLNIHIINQDTFSHSICLN